MPLPWLAPLGWGGGGGMYDFLTLGGWRAVACPSPGRIKREKGVWWMPWQQEAMKDVIPCDKLWGAGNRL